MAKNKGGRPPVHDPKDIVPRICEAVSGGTLVKDVCEAEGINVTTLWRWLEKDEELRKAYARAREEQAHAIAEEILTISDAQYATSEEVQRARLRVDSRKWLASKIAPRTYGEKIQQENTGPNGGPIVVEVVYSNEAVKRA